MADFELNMQMSLLQQADSVSCLQNYTDDAPSPSICSITESFRRRMKIGDEATMARKKGAVRRAEKVKKMEGDRIKLPRSVSVWCNGFIKGAKGGD
ncbi:hypothetical protein L6452_20983 [Arctium lappa]|uniref:Uncharacterized protein n=1 Tax=Arctium lappa TaxID=4217 RepID=A0ACB9BDC3_ARCLA|nr:hypothetical protein L6452_20983 [Arctium lappa]